MGQNCPNLYKCTLYVITAGAELSTDLNPDVHIRDNAREDTVPVADTRGRVEESHNEGCCQGVVTEKGSLVVVRVTSNIRRDQLLDKVHFRLVIDRQ